VPGKPFHADALGRREWDPELYVDGHGDADNASNVSAYNEIVRVLEIGQRPMARWQSRAYALSVPAAETPLRPQRNAINVAFHLHSQDAQAVYGPAIKAYCAMAAQQDHTRQAYLRDLVVALCLTNGHPIDQPIVASAAEETQARREEREMRVAVPATETPLPTAYGAAVLYRQARLPYLVLEQPSTNNRHRMQLCSEEWSSVDDLEKARFEAIARELKELRRQLVQKRELDAANEAEADDDGADSSELEEEDAEPSDLNEATVVRFDGTSWLKGEVSAFVEQGAAGNEQDNWAVTWEGEPRRGGRSRRQTQRAAEATAAGVAGVAALAPAAATARVEEFANAVALDAALLERLLVDSADRATLRRTRPYKNLVS